jgi:AraC-like DNA-binding protein
VPPFRDVRSEKSVEQDYQSDHAARKQGRHPPPRLGNGTETFVRVTTATVSAVLEDLGMEDGAASSRLHGNAEVLAYIEDNLGLRTLDADHLCERFGLSRSNLYRQFERVGGVTTFIRNRRLEAAFDDLNTSARRSGRIDAIARGRGFASEDSFARAFRRRYGFSPKDMQGTGRKAGVRAARGESGPSTLSGWIRAIGVRQPERA